jgi:hypothetical protein
MPRPYRLLLAGVLLALVTLLMGCGGGAKSTSEPVPAGDAIIIGSISPAEGTKLAPGSTVNFQVTCNYRLVSSSTGVVMLTVTDGLGDILPNGTASINVQQGEASVPLAATVTIPTTIALVQVNCELLPNGKSTDVIAANVNFAVGT